MRLLRKAIVPLLASILIITLFTGCAGAQGAAGVSVTGATINSSGDLVLTLSNGNTVTPAMSSGLLVQPVQRAPQAQRGLPAPPDLLDLPDLPAPADQAGL